MLAGTLAIVLAGIAVARLASPDVGTAALRVSLAWVLLTVTFPSVDDEIGAVLQRHGMGLNVFATLTSAALVALAWWAGGRIANSARKRDVIAVANITSICFVLTNVAYIVVANSATPNVPNSAPELRLSRGHEPRTIVFVVPDGLGRLDVLRDYYGVDTTRFEGALRARGFFVPRANRSNYSQTYLSLASTLNLTYLDAVARARRGTSDRRPLHDYIEHNAIIPALKRVGYTIGWVGSSYSATRENEWADKCDCGAGDVSELGLAILKGSPFAHAALEPWTYAQHRTHIEHSFDVIPTLAAAAPRRFVFAHVLVPHPPFVFGPHATVPSWRFTYWDGDNYPGTREEYRRGYAEQTIWLFDRILRVIDRVLAADPQAVIVIESDHGPGLRLRQESPARTDARERLSNFAALRLPGARAACPDDLSPVNLFRVVFNAYFDARLPLLPNRSFLAPYNEPYELYPVGDELFAPPRLQARLSEAALATRP